VAEGRHRSARESVGKSSKDGVRIDSKEYADRCAELGLETLKKRRQNQDMGLFYKLLNGEEESNLFTLADRPGAVRTRQAAGTKSLVAKFARTDQRKFSFSERTLENWNRLPENTTQAATQNGFKRSLKQTRQ
jgi:ribonucleases P/MRP protein subunit RPP40